MTSRERLIGSWTLTDYVETPVDGGPDRHPLGHDPLGAILHNPEGYMSAQLSPPLRQGQAPSGPNGYHIAYHSGPSRSTERPVS